MAHRRHKSNLDRLVEANRGRSKRARKITKSYQPPEAAIDTADDLDEDVSVVPVQDLESGSGPAIANGAAQYPDEEDDWSNQTTVSTPEAGREKSPEELLDDLVSGVEEGDAEDSAQTGSTEEVAPVPPKNPVTQSVLDSKFRRPAGAPLKPIAPPQPRRPESSDGDRISAGQLLVELPLPVYRNYLSQKKDGQPLRELVAKRLIDCQNYTSEKPLYINDTLRRRIEQFAHRDFSSAEELVGWLISSLDIFVGAQGLTIEPYLMQRAKDRLPPDQTLAEYLSELLTYGIEVKTGMR